MISRQNLSNWVRCTTMILRHILYICFKKSMKQLILVLFHFSPTKEKKTYWFWTSKSSHQEDFFLFLSKFHIFNGSEISRRDKQKAIFNTTKRLTLRAVKISFFRLFFAIDLQVTSFSVVQILTRNSFKNKTDCYAIAICGRSLTNRVNKKRYV